MKTIQSMCLGLALLLVTVSPCIGAQTSVNVNVSKGESSTMVYDLNVKQTYDAWVSNANFELSPFAQLGGHAWVPKHGSDDTVWGGDFTPGLRFALNTSAMLQPFFEGAVGAAINNEKKVGPRELGSHVLFKYRGSVGVSFGESYQHTVRGDYTNHTTLGMTKKDDGFGTYGVSYGYSF